MVVLEESVKAEVIISTVKTVSGLFEEFVFKDLVQINYINTGKLIQKGVIEIQGNLARPLWLLL